ncbi:uncharacterized protein LOC106174474 [Lingula anatina]|uniref:Uncharacterized protein LOC106174474 n=1 Tax=Lingula anatina TaxID=7574 RepID=A0A1S3JM90_LINAN|nr:uncharacterized protein LOC106174474 [Lingula anatina]|eukprot:XP_013411503.1 uncharacterized protein LOC106174474 [Lingula anatina]
MAVKNVLLLIGLIIWIQVTRGIRFDADLGLEDIDVKAESSSRTSLLIHTYLTQCLSQNLQDRFPPVPTPQQLRVKTNDRCTERVPTVRKCKGGIARFGYNSVKKACEYFEWDGCDQSGNLFESMVECQLWCESPCTSRNAVNACPKTEDGDLFYVDPDTGLCKGISYDQCGGLPNVYETAAECLAVVQSCANASDGGRKRREIQTVFQTRAHARTKRQVSNPENLDLAIQTFCTEFEKHIPNFSDSILTLSDSTKPDNNKDFAGVVEKVFGVAETSLFDWHPLCDQSRSANSVATRLASDVIELDNIIHAKTIDNETYKYTGTPPPNPTTSPDPADPWWRLSDQEDSTSESTTDPPTDGDSGRRRRRRSVAACDFGLRYSHLNWIHAVIYEGCRHVDVHVRLNCIAATFHPPPEGYLEQFCELAREGIEKYWSRAVTISGQSWSVKVHTHVTPFLSKPVVIKFYDTPRLTVTAQHADNLPMTVRMYAFLDNAKEVFARAAAHQFGHAILSAVDGFIESWSHKGTSTIFGNFNSNAQQYPITGEIDLMQYFLPNTQSLSAILARTIATEDDVKKLVHSALLKLPFSGCVGDVGSPCKNSSDCTEERCLDFRCAGCSVDSECSPPNTYCHAANNSLVVNECRATKVEGEYCTRDEMCKKGLCDGLHCVECKEDYHCLAHQFCKNKAAPFNINYCADKLPVGGQCTGDSDCLSGKCSGFRCVSCDSDGDCSDGYYCRVAAGTCALKKETCESCTRDAMCQTGQCHELVCVECTLDSACAVDQYCKNDSAFQCNVCAEKLPRTALCNRGRMCQSDKCVGFPNRCVDCQDDSDCTLHQYCTSLLNPFIANQCVEKKSTGFCTRASMCKSGTCRLLPPLSCAPHRYGP